MTTGQLTAAALLYYDSLVLVLTNESGLIWFDFQLGFVSSLWFYSERPSIS